MAMNVSEFVWHRLDEWGLKRVYGYPGDGVGGLDVALERATRQMQYVQVRHEEMAAFMASAHAKFTGEVGLCYATSGPGAIHLSERPVRREDGPCARRRHRRPTGPVRARRALSAGGRPSIVVQGRGRRFRRAWRVCRRRCAI